MPSWNLLDAPPRPFQFHCHSLKHPKHGVIRTQKDRDWNIEVVAYFSYIFSRLLAKRDLDRPPAEQAEAH